MRIDLVPCYYVGQDRLREQPAEVLPRADVRRYKALKLGKFVSSGKVFLFFAHVAGVAFRIAEKISFWDGPVGVGNILPFAKPHNYGDKLHYDMPMAGDKGMRRHGLFSRANEETGIPELHTHQIHVSGRNLFAQQHLPA